MSTLATEYEGDDPERAEAARYLLEELSGYHSSRWLLVLGGMLADLLFEHSRWVHAGDVDDPDPVAVTKAMHTFMER